MARQEQDKEDLMREAVALRERVELDVPGESEPVTAGFRSTGALAIYFGGDPVYQFDPAGLLRRAFANGLLYRTQGHTLAELTRVHTETSSELLRRDLSEAELAEFSQTATTRLDSLRRALQTGTATVRCQVPEDLDLRPRLLKSLNTLLAAPLALAPAVPGRR